MFKIGDIALGRPNLGHSMPVFIYRLLEVYVMEILQETYGKEASDEVFRAAGRRAGLAYSEEYIDKTLEFDDFVLRVQESLNEHKVGILRVERANLETKEITLSIYEDLDCSGLPVTGENVCVYDEGFIGGIFEYYTGEEFKVREVDCWASGERVCRFKVEVKKQEKELNSEESLKEKLIESERETAREIEKQRELAKQQSKEEMREMERKKVMQSEGIGLTSKEIEREIEQKLEKQKEIEIKKAREREELREKARKRAIQIELEISKDKERRR